jgi:signal transduction histidine kinase
MQPPPFRIFFKAFQPDKGIAIAMQNRYIRSWQLLENLIPIGVLALLLAFTYAFFFIAPYSGFFFNPSNGKIETIYISTNSTASLRIGDIILKIGPLTRERFTADATQVFFENANRADIVKVTVERDGQELTVPWVFPGLNRQEFISRLLNNWWLAFFFWAFGLATQLFMRPKDNRRRLLMIANYLTSLWLIFGNLSTWQIWGSSVLFHSITWLIAPVYLNLHWDFPKPFKRLPLAAWLTLYLVAGFCAVGQFVQFFPRSFYLLGFLLMLAGSIALLAVHFARQPEQRSEVGLLVIAILIALMPSISVGIIEQFGNLPNAGSLALLTLPIMPGAYFFAVYRRQLGGLELRANRVITFVIYGALLLTLSFPVAFAINAWSNENGTTVTFGLAFTLVASIGTALIYPYFQRWIEVRLLGIPLPPAQVLENYAAHITTSMEVGQLRRVICDEILPSLQIRQAALFRLGPDKTPDPVFMMGVSKEQFPLVPDLPALLVASGQVRPAIQTGDGLRPCPWARLILKLSYEGEAIGLCLLGRRDPDDFYSAAEIPILQALMDQTALALKNIEQADHLQAFYKADIERQEFEHNRLAMELHDEVLGQMALLAISAADSVMSTQFEQAYAAATEHIRHIIDGLQPTMLNYGLQPALDELADNIAALGTGTKIKMELPPNEVRYAPVTELHLFRIAQQACQNALQHAQAKTICIRGRLEPGMGELVMEDDGIGFSGGDSIDLLGLLANKHFGLAGMYERAALIGANMKIETSPGKGTRVIVFWQTDKPMLD